MLDICVLGDDVLRTECKDIKVFDSALKMLADAMLETLKEADGVGLAGPQVGVPDPEIVETSIETCPYEEGCLSVPGMYHNVVRPKRVKVQAFDADGKPFTLDADGLLARVIQHENDHLHGKLYIDYLTDAEREKLLRLYEKKNKARKNRKRRV